MIYHNSSIDKDKILKDNKGKAGIYMWIHKESGKIYIGSAFDLSKRLRNYFKISYLKQADYYISRALLRYSHLAFSLSMIEYIDITNLSKEDARKLILEREQYYLDFIFLEDKPNTYNINPSAGSRLGSLHTEKTKALLSQAMAGENHPNFGKFLSVETKALILALLL